MPVDDFGPFDLLAEWAHAEYLDGFDDRAVLRCREGLVLTRAAGDVRTARFLHYTAGTVLQESGRFSEAAVEAGELLALLDEAAGPFWRAKALALLAEARIGLGQIAEGMDHLAEGRLLVGGAVTTYNHLSAVEAVALAMRAVLLFEEADAMVVPLARAQVRGPDVEVVVLQSASMTQLMWGAMLELTGDHAAARSHYVTCLSRVAWMRAAAEAREDAEMLSRTVALEGLCLVRLGEPALAEARIRGAAAGARMREEVPATQVARIALALAVSERGDFAEAHRLLTAATASTEHLLRQVWHTYALAAQAAVLALEHGRHPSAEQWRRLARLVVRRLVEDRQGLFAALADRIRVRELAVESEAMSRAVLEDPLTGLGNRRLLAEQVAGGERRLAVVFLDVDRFKEINDTWSHEVGDGVLRRVAALLRAQCRTGDVVIRYGGDEFVVLLPGGQADAALVASRVHAAVHAEDWEAIAPGLSVTVSVGVSALQPTTEALLEADAALLRAKREGRDRVAVAPPA